MRKAEAFEGGPARTQWSVRPEGRKQRRTGSWAAYTAGMVELAYSAHSVPFEFYLLLNQKGKEKYISSCMHHKSIVGLAIEGKKVTSKVKIIEKVEKFQ